MKSLLIAAALVTVPAAASAQIAAGTVPNTFDPPAQAAPAGPAARPAATPATTPAATTPNPKSEDTLRDFIAAVQAGAIDYGIFTPDLAGKVREQEASVTTVIQGFGTVQAVDFVRSEEGSDLFAITFANGGTEWLIGFRDDKVAALLFRPAQ